MLDRQFEDIHKQHSLLFPLQYKSRHFPTVPSQDCNEVYPVAATKAYSVLPCCHTHCIHTNYISYLLTTRQYITTYSWFWVIKAVSKQTLCLGCSVKHFTCDIYFRHVVIFDNSAQPLNVMSHLIWCVLPVSSFHSTTTALTAPNTSRHR